MVSAATIDSVDLVNSVYLEAGVSSAPVAKDPNAYHPIANPIQEPVRGRVPVSAALLRVTESFIEVPDSYAAKT